MSDTFPRGVDASASGVLSSTALSQSLATFSLHQVQRSCNSDLPYKVYLCILSVHSHSLCVPELLDISHLLPGFMPRVVSQTVKMYFLGWSGSMARRVLALHAINPC